MRRDMELLREIMLRIEAHESGWAPRKLELEGFTDEQIGYHILLLIEAGLLEGANTTSRGSNSPSAIATRLTWEGHEFVDAAREPARWQAAREQLQQVGQVTLPVLTALLSKLMMQGLGIE